MTQAGVKKCKETTSLPGFTLIHRDNWLTRISPGEYRPALSHWESIASYILFVTAYPLTISRIIFTSAIKPETAGDRLQGKVSFKVVSLQAGVSTISLHRQTGLRTLLDDHEQKQLLHQKFH